MADKNCTEMNLRLIWRPEGQLYVQVESRLLNAGMIYPTIPSSGGYYPGLSRCYHQEFGPWEDIERI